MRSHAALLTFGLTALAALATSGCGKGAKGDCPQLDICGGSPVLQGQQATSWKVGGFCQVLPVRPAQPEDVIDFTSAGLQAPTIAPPPANPTAATQTTSGDWCSSLVLVPGTPPTVTNANLFHEAPQIAQDQLSTMIFAIDDPARPDRGSYVTQLVFKIPQDTTHFAPRCLVANGAVNPTCADLGPALNAYYNPPGSVLPPTFGNIMCAPSTADGGCDCTYDVLVEVDDKGQWALDPSDPTILLQASKLLTFNGVTMNAEASTTMLQSAMCSSASQLDLSGVRGGSLSNVQGLRTLSLTPM